MRAGVSLNVCFVCRLPIRPGREHTFHAEDCPNRTEPGRYTTCAELDGCGEDCHLGCCPTCTLFRMQRLGQLEPDPCPPHGIERPAQPDIVERLREIVRRGGLLYSARTLMSEAADEIEQLREMAFGGAS
jgi:hypothetical protein